MAPRSSKSSSSCALPCNPHTTPRHQEHLAGSASPHLHPYPSSCVVSSTRHSAANRSGRTSNTVSAYINVDIVGSHRHRGALRMHRHSGRQQHSSRLSGHVLPHQANQGARTQTPTRRAHTIEPMATGTPAWASGANRPVGRATSLPTAVATCANTTHAGSNSVIQTKQGQLKIGTPSGSTRQLHWF